MLKRMQIMVPEELYKSLREEAFNLHTSISKLIVGKLLGPIVANGAAKPIKFTGPLSETPQGKAINKFKERIPLSKEMEEKILNPKDIGQPRGRVRYR